MSELRPLILQATRQQCLQTSYRGGLVSLLIQRKKSGWGVGSPLAPPKSSLISIGEEIRISSISSLVSLQKERVQNVWGLCEGRLG